MQGRVFDDAGGRVLQCCSVICLNDAGRRVLQ